jgi:ATP-dependent Lhr-like helicase
MLDEEFVSEYGEIGKKFILRGSVWKIQQIYNAKVFVVEDDDPMGAIPSWVGEEIPVPAEVAMEVGSLRRRAAGGAADPVALHDLLGQLASQYPMKAEGFERSLATAVRQHQLNLAVASDTSVTIERWRDLVVVMTHRGLRTNRTLGRLLAHRCSAGLGKPVGTSQDAYRIFLEGKELTCEAVRDALVGLAGSDLQSYIVLACEDTGLFRRRFVHVARKMGILARDAELTSSLVKQLVETYKGGLPYKEAWRTFLQEDLDPRGTSTLLAEVSGGKVVVALLGDLPEPSPLAMVGLEEMTRKGEVMDPARMRRLLLESARSRVLNAKATLVCTSCWSYVEEKYVVDLPERSSCPLCHSDLVAASYREHDETAEMVGKIRRGKGASASMARARRELESSARLDASFGLAAIKAQVFNITDARLADILERPPGNEDELLLRLLDEERKSYLKRFVGPT